MKKLTHGGGAPVVLSVLALVLSLIASFQEYLCRFIYNLAFDGDTDKVFVESILGYFTMNRNDVNVITLYTEKAFILAVISFMAVLMFALSGKKKTIVIGQAWTLAATAGACLIEPVIYLVNFFSGDIKDGLSADNDGVVFRTTYGLLIYALPAVVCLLLIIAAIIILCRIGAEQNKVEVARKGTAPASVAVPATAPVVTPAFPTNEMPSVSAFESPVIPQAAQPENAMPDVVVPQNYAPIADESAPQEDIAEAAAQEIAEDVAPIQETPAYEPVIDDAPKSLFCATCGNPLDANAKFCNNCGTRR